jgi:hypothetical protein
MNMNTKVLRELGDNRLVYRLSNGDEPRLNFIVYIFISGHPFFEFFKRFVIVTFFDFHHVCQLEYLRRKKSSGLQTNPC